MRIASTPMSSQKRIALSTSSITAGLSKFKIRLVRKEAMPVVLLRHIVPVQLDFSVSVKMIRASR